MDDRELARLLSAIQPKGRDVLRRAMRAEQFERDELAARLLEERSPAARDVADLLDLASLHPEVRLQLARVLGHLEALG
jgi:predicted component of type VI protein secretion system